MSTSTYFGTSAADSLTGSSGDDYMDGQGGNDTLRAGSGNDTLWGDAGHDLLDGGAGNDTLGGEGGNDSLYGGDGADYLLDQTGSNLLDGGSGNDSLYGDTGSTLLGGSGSDLLWVNSGNNLLDGGADADSLYGGTGNDTLLGGDGDDYIQINAGNNSVNGGAGNDTIYANTGDDTLDGGTGADYLFGGYGDDLYIVDHLDDQVDERGLRTDVDRLLVLVDDYALPSGIEQVSYGEGVRVLPYFIQGLASGTSWAGIGNGYSVSYSFVQTSTGTYSGHSAYTDAEKAAVRSALAQYSALSGLTFSELADDSAADVRFFQHSISDAAGYAYYQGDVHLGSDIDGSAGDTYLMLHEIGHSMGLKHSFESPALPQDEDSQANTVMSYNNWWPLPSSLQMYDIATLHYLYGVNHGVRSGDQSYSLGEHYIWDGGGNDSLSAAGQSLAVSIDLRPGSWNWIGSRSDSILDAGQSFLGFDSWIEHASGGDGNDLLSGNDLGNRLDGGAGNDSLQGGAGADSLYGGSGSDTLDGGSGNDWLDGGAGSDRILFGAGSGQDTLDASQSGGGTDLIVLADGLDLPALQLTRPDDSADLRLGISGSSASLTLRGFFAAGHSSAELLLGGDSLISDSLLRQLATGIEPATVSISGTLQEGQILQAGTDLSDPQQLASLSYRWMAGDQLLGSGSSLLLTRAMVGLQIQLQVSYEISGVGTQHAGSTLTAAVAVLNSAPSGSLAISGDLLVGATLQAVSSLADADGLGSLSYQWLADGSPIAGATGSSLLLTSAQFGSPISLRVSWTDGYGTAESVLSSATAAVGASNQPPGGSLTLTGTTSAGDWLGVSSSLADPDGMGSLSYQWLADGEAIAGASGTTLQLTRAEVGRSISVRASYTDGWGNPTSVDSSAVSVSARSLGSGNDRFSGGTIADAVLGLAGNDSLYGLAGADLLDGGDGNDLLDGGTGDDSLIGGSGDDRYYLDSAGDRIAELEGGGFDSAWSSASCTLDAWVEKLTLTGTAALDATGNAQANLIYGNSGANRLDGGAGADSLYGGAGADTYVIEHAGDLVFEKGSDFDRVESAVSWVMVKKVEALQLTGTDDLYGIGNSGHEQLGGNSGDNLLYGLKGNDSLDGGAGHDTLNGGLGADQLTGGSGHDVFVLASLKDSTLKPAAMDSILDFSRGSDRLDLSLLDADSRLAGDQAFSEFIASDALFSRAGQLQLVGDVLYGNTDADSKAEFAIRLVGISALGLDDLIA